MLLANEKGKRMAKVLNSGIAAIFLLSLLLLCGCASKAPNYYVLHSLQGEAPDVKTARAENDLTIGVGPIKIPEYLDRPQMATRSTPYSLQFAEFDKWAEPLDKNLASVLAENLSILLSTDQGRRFSMGRVRARSVSGNRGRCTDGIYAGWQSCARRRLERFRQ